MIICVTPSLALTVSYDPVYDSRDASLDGVARSNGDHGMLTRGYKTFGDLPTFPNIGGTSNIAQVWDVLEPDVYHARRRTEDGDNYCDRCVHGHAQDSGLVEATAVQVLHRSVDCKNVRALMMN